MKISIIIKALIASVLCGFLFLGCGGGQYGGGSANDSTSEDRNDGGGGGGGDNSGGSSVPKSKVKIEYNSLENNITNYRGMFNLVADNHVEPEQLDNHSTIYTKHIIYHDVDAKIGAALSPYLNGNMYQSIHCTYADSPPGGLCEEYSRTKLPSSVNGIYMANIVFNQNKATGCAEADGVCDITLFTAADPAVFNNTNPIPFSTFKNAFTEEYIDGVPMRAVLDKIEKNAKAVSMETYTFYNDKNLTTYRNINSTVRRYTDFLTHNDGSDISIPQVPLTSSGENGEGVSKVVNEIAYTLENTYGKFGSKKVDYDVNESDPAGVNYWMTDVSSPDNFNFITLCQRSKNSTAATPIENATNATYTCEEGSGNISSHWILEGGSINMNWN
ncbi:MAG: hypothetical protein LBQ18_04350 [Campylobacteraceae bacterium]|jgi:hypothetical protein|nr:hypothetical protein [Campylobacteraceae bacterium]